jgi:hypothetical protein
MDAVDHLVPWEEDRSACDPGIGSRESHHVAAVVAHTDHLVVPWSRDPLHGAYCHSDDSEAAEDQEAYQDD